ncbi:Cytidine and deoxycytidylate deaminase [Gracilaria domingensis]|nr:Cytidine and deoxycytidylate deaminase [Gracilaria domingensis]
MESVATKTHTAPSISSDELDKLVAEADKAKLKAYVTPAEDNLDETKANSAYRIIPVMRHTQSFETARKCCKKGVPSRPVWRHADTNLFFLLTGRQQKQTRYGLTVCAERSAIFHAASCGARSFRAIVITTDIAESHVYPCGACRQVMSEFGNFDVYLLRANGRVSRTTLNELIPYAFSPKDLNKEQEKAEEEE